MELTQARVRELFDYHPDGYLVRRTKQSIRTEIGQRVGCLHSSGYLVAHVDKKLYKVHRLIFLWHHGYLPRIVDHADMNTINNRIGNLRNATKSQNNSNMRARSTNVSGLKGVYLHKQTGKWCAEIRVNYKKHYLGLFHTKEEAHHAYKEAADRLHGEFARAG